MCVCVRVCVRVAREHSRDRSIERINQLNVRVSAVKMGTSWDID